MKTRIIARLDVKPPYVIKGVHFEGLRKVGLPEELAVKYYRQGADEIFYIDAVASLYRRDILYDYIEKTAQNIFVPFCVGGGVKSIEDITRLLHKGADKVALCTFAVQNPDLINEAAKIFGSQCIVISIQAKKWENYWECYTDCGRIRTGKDALLWAKEAEERGAGEILVTSVDCEGRRRGFDVELVRRISETVNVPVIASGGAGNPGHIKDVIEKGKAGAVAIATLLHYDNYSISDIRRCLEPEKVEVLR